ncbi:hypothetical protein HJC23_004537 [Cyclotella cryptica]|uniref:Chitin-binding type-2 domain-containing protein n=1 Tax=Cyclotella cryptica TaxID=29204 RepID=A0ABD3QAP6_9STRA
MPSTFRHSQRPTALSFCVLLLHSHSINGQSQSSSTCTTHENVCSGAGPSKRPLPGCSTFAQCDTTTNSVISIQTCLAGSIFDTLLETCNWNYVAFCDVASCPPTEEPTPFPTTEEPSWSPSKRPTAPPTGSPTVTPTSIPSLSPSFTKESIVQDFLLSKQDLIEKYILISYTSSGLAYPSRQYKFDDFFSSLQLMGIQGFGSGFQFMLYEGDAVKYQYGLVNLAAFLANAMVETIQNDACDELNWQEVAGRYAISNSCGQEGRSYQDETCNNQANEDIFSCQVDTNMEIIAISSGNQVRAPPPFKCEAGRGEGFYAGYWDTETGTEVADIPYSNSNGRTDTEGCCWWGRGALSTRGICNIGKFNYYVGMKAALDGRPSLYPNIDFCQYPEAVCSSDATNELRWTISMFEWAERIQRYTSDQWSYENQLTTFVDRGMNDDSFIDSVGRILSLGCHQEGCSDFEVRHADQRKANFYLILNDVFSLKFLLQPTPQPGPTVTPGPSLQLDFEVDVPNPVAMPQPWPPILPPTTEITSPQPGASYEELPPSYDIGATGDLLLLTAMPTNEHNDSLMRVEENASGRLLRSSVVSFLVVFYCFSLNK